jgi:hypothetical protein
MSDRLEKSPCWQSRGRLVLAITSRSVMPLAVRLGKPTTEAMKVRSMESTDLA